MSTPFNSTTNVTGILLDKPAMSKARGGSGNSNGAAPNFVDGALLGNDAEFFLYGGDLLENSDLYESPPRDEVLGYQAYQYGPDKPTWKPGFVDKKLDKGVTRYVAYGGAANVPSENLAFYFSGLRSPSKGEFFTNDPEKKATNVSDTLITLNLEEQLYETWSNTTLDKVKGRANAEVVWVPVGKKGILVVLGGVVYPQWAGRSGKSANEAESVSNIATDIPRCIADINFDNRRSRALNSCRLLISTTSIRTSGINKKPRTVPEHEREDAP